MNRIVLNIKMLPHCDWLKGFGQTKTKTQSREWRYEAILNNSLFEHYQTPLHATPEMRKKQMCSEGWGADLPTFRLRVVACIVGVKKREGGGQAEVKNGEEMGREGKGRRRSFFIFPFTLFSSPPPPHFCAHHHRLSQAMRSLRRV